MTRCWPAGEFGWEKKSCDSEAGLRQVRFPIELYSSFELEFARKEGRKEREGRQAVDCRVTIELLRKKESSDSSGGQRAGQLEPGEAGGGAGRLLE